MPLLELTLNATHEAIDWVRTLLSTTDYICDVVVTSPQPGVSPPWVCTCHLYLPHDALSRSRTEKIATLLAPLHRTGQISELEMAVVEPPVQAQNESIHRVGQRFVIIAPGVAYQPEMEDVPIWLTQSLSFGSGFHPATMCSLQLLERHTQAGMQTLDLGSGSGILSIAMARLGATVLALDNDRTAVEATRAAVVQNQVADQVTVMEGSLGQGSELGHWMNLTAIANTPRIASRFDLIAANILARIHIALADEFRQALGPSGILVAAGFTQDYEPEVSAALKQSGFAIIDQTRLDEWVALAYQV